MTSPSAKKRSITAPSRRFIVFLVLAIVVFGAGGTWLYGQLTHIVVTDARVAADMVTLSSRVPGWIVSLDVTEGDHLDKNTVLLRIDDRDSRLRLKELDAQLAALQAQRTEIQARITQKDEATTSRIAAQEAAVTAAQASLASAKAKLDLAKTENTRATRLVSSGTTTRAHADQTRTDLEAAHQSVLSAAANLRSAEAALGEARAERGMLAVLRSQLAALAPEEHRLRAERSRTALDVNDRVIRMPLTGVVDRVFVDQGEYVSAGQRLLLVHDQKRIRIEANVKETTLHHLKPGDDVAVTVDALPGQTFHGTVDRLGEAATSEFALLPSPNPSGNFTKITQRLPVRIAIAQVQDQLKPGMMVEVEAKTGD